METKLARRLPQMDLWFCQCCGGIIFIGKDNAGKVVHLADYPLLMEIIPQKIRDLLGIVCDVNLLKEEANKYIEIKVNPYSVPVSLRGRYYYRSGSTKLELTGVELTEFLLKKSGKSWDEAPEEAAKISDIDENSLSRFIQEGEESGKNARDQWIINIRSTGQTSSAGW